MKKIIKIDSCCHCPYMADDYVIVDTDHGIGLSDTYKRYYCTSNKLSRKKLISLKHDCKELLAIPTWCPLESEEDSVASKAWISNSYAFQDGWAASIEYCEEDGPSIEQAWEQSGTLLALQQDFPGYNEVGEKVDEN